MSIRKMNAVEVHDGIFVGSGTDVYKFAGSVLHCAKRPWYDSADALFSQTLTDLTGSLIDVLRDSPADLTFFRQYHYPTPNVIRIRYNEMALNLIDSTNPAHFQDNVINAGLDFITERLAEGDPVLVHCNNGISRGPSIALLWMWEHGFLNPDFREALPQFRELYPNYCPSNGIRDYLENRMHPSEEKE